MIEPDLEQAVSLRGAGGLWRLRRTTVIGLGAGTLAGVGTGEVREMKTLKMCPRLLLGWLGMPFTQIN